METIEKGNFENIEKEVTPRAFQNCESSSLRMGMKVCTAAITSLCSQMMKIKLAVGKP